MAYTWEVLSNVSNSDTWWDWLLSIISFLTNLVVLLINILKGLFMAIGRFAQQIFNWTFFNYVVSTFEFLSNFIWTAGASLLMGLFGLAFMIIVFQFLFKLLRGRVSYDSTLKKYNKNHPSK